MATTTPPYFGPDIPTPMSIPNPELQLANDFVRHTDCTVFLTGKAGTGKTTFLHHLKTHTPKRMVVTAPTGAAAINAGGVTLHSFFQMPFGPFVPGSEAHGHTNQRRFNKEKINIIKSLDLLVIDEISMVRADLLDGVDAVLRRYRGNDLPFGGVQLLMIGDLYQLSPVVKNAEWQILRDYYESIYFFSSQALRHTELISIELQHIYRQSDRRFIELLNRVRDNRHDQETLEALNMRHLPDFVPPDNEGYITLGTHNRGVDLINESKLGALKAKTRRFTATVEGDFPEHTYPAPAELELKVGAQVMFVRNDASRDKLYFNGKIGKITRIADTKVSIQCPGDSEEITVEPATWENIKYSLDKDTKEITEDKVGQFAQYPLKLAWAITIHKSQGLTFEKAVIDANGAFAHGQVYVALSRCKTFEGMVLSSPLSSHCVKRDNTVSNFVSHASQNPPSSQRLTAAKLSYQQRLLLECFDFARLRSRLNWFLRLLLSNARVITLAGGDDIHAMESRGVAEICLVGENFKQELQRLFAKNNLPESDTVVLQRINKASLYFQEKIETILAAILRGLRVDTDNKEIGKKVKDALNKLNQEIAVKSAAVKSCEPGFSPARYLRAISAAAIDFKPSKAKKTTSIQYTAADVGHPELFQAMHDWRSEKADNQGLPHYRVLHQSVLIQIAVNLPDNPADLKKIKGIGPSTVEKHGKELLDMVSAYRQKKGITAVELPEPEITLEQVEPKEEKMPQVNTRQVSLDLFQSGLTVRQIAAERGLVTSTIERHLAFFVHQGKLDMDLLLSPAKQQAIARKIAEMKESSLRELKISLGDDYSYDEIKLMLTRPE